LRPIRRFCFRRSRPCYPNSFGTGSHRIETISASAFAPEPERTENINVAVASTARAAWPSLQTRLLVRPPPAPRLSSRHARYRFGSIPSRVPGRRGARLGADPRHGQPHFRSQTNLSQSGCFKLGGVPAPIYAIYEMMATCPSHPPCKSSERCSQTAAPHFWLACTAGFARQFRWAGEAVHLETVARRSAR
jgi:hypothetical protein